MGLASVPRGGRAGQVILLVAIDGWLRGLSEQTFGRHVRDTMPVWRPGLRELSAIGCFIEA